MELWLYKLDLEPRYGDFICYIHTMEGDIGMTHWDVHERCRDRSSIELCDSAQCLRDHISIGLIGPKHVPQITQLCEHLALFTSSIKISSPSYRVINALSIDSGESRRHN